MKQAISASEKSYMEKVVYILGAGFSAPLGLPVVSNFRIKSQEMFLEDPERYKHFQRVYDELNKMAVAKNFYQTDLYNIEEILSILEMGDFVQSKRLKDEFILYLKEVILYHTPKIVPYGENLPGNWEVAIFSNQQNWNGYGYFIAALLKLAFHQEVEYVINGYGPLEQKRFLTYGTNPFPPATYGVITLNYDLIPEMVWEFLKTHHRPDGTVNGFRTGQVINEERGVIEPVWSPTGPVTLSKLHGSLDGVIVPPTWSKGATPEIIPAWKLAHRLLEEATQIRIVGFSLPIGDAYIKYLMKSAALNNPFLKHIDVICLDYDGSVRRRYDDFISYGGYRFVNGNTSEYLQQHHALCVNQSTRRGGEHFLLDKLEQAHHAFMTQ